MYYDAAIKEAFKSSYKIRMGAIVVYKGKILGKGHNKVCSTGARIDGKHAEIDALNNTPAKNRKGSTVYVCRIAKNGNVAMAKPCEACIVVMKKIGVKYVWYSESDCWKRIML